MAPEVRSPAHLEEDYAHFNDKGPCRVAWAVLGAALGEWAVPVRPGGREGGLAGKIRCQNPACRGRSHSNGLNHGPFARRAGFPAGRFGGLSSPQYVRRARKPAEPAARKGCPTRHSVSARHGPTSSPRPRHPMTQPRRILPLAIVALLIGVIGWQLYTTREPSYQARTLTEWLVALDSAPPEEPTKEAQARTAIHAIGTNGLPILLRMVQAQDSALKKKLMKWAKQQSVVDLRFTPAMRSRYLAVTGFEVLGSEAKDAIPALAALLSNTNSGGMAAKGLTMVGSEGIPILRHGLTNVNASVRISCLTGLYLAGTNGFATLPEILPCLHDPVLRVRQKAVFCLQNFQHDPATVLPALWHTVELDQDTTLRSLSIWTMGFFSSQASAYVPGLQQLLLSTNANALPLFEELTNALKSIDPAAWPNGGAPPPAGSPTNLSSVGPAFQPAGSGGFPAPSTSGGPESPPNRQPGKAALPDAASPRAVGQPVHGVQGIP